MTQSEFWFQLELNPEMIAHETRDYFVVVTPRAWREQARAETDRNLMEYSLLNRTYWTLESGSNNLMTAIMTADTLQAGLDDVNKKDLTSANIIGFPRQDRTE